MKIIKNGTLVSSSKIWKADIAIEGHRIKQIESDINPTVFDEVYDATGCYVFPGFIDGHTHFDMDTGVHFCQLCIFCSLFLQKKNRPFGRTIFYDLLITSYLHAPWHDSCGTWAYRTWSTSCG